MAADGAENLAVKRAVHLAGHQEQVDAVEQSGGIGGETHLSLVAGEDIEAVGGVAADGVLHEVEIADDGGDIGHLHLRRDQAGSFDAGAGRNVAGSKPVEDGGRAKRHLAESPDWILGAADAVRAGARLRGEGARPLGVAEQRFAHLSILRIAEVGGGVASLRVEQDLGDDRLQIAAHAQAVVFEDGGAVADVRRAWVAGDQMLDHLLAEERRQIGVIEERVERDLEIAIGVSGCRRQEW